MDHILKVTSNSNNMSFSRATAHGALELASVMADTAAMACRFAAFIASPLLFVDGAASFDSARAPSRSYFNCGTKEEPVGCGYVVKTFTGNSSLSTKEESIHMAFTQMFVATPLTIIAGMIGSRVFNEIGRQINKVNQSF